MTEDFVTVVTANRRALCNKAFSMLRNREDAEDAVQDALLNAYRFLPRFRGDCLMSTWLTSCVINSCLMKIRKIKPATMLGRHVEYLLDREPSPELKAITKEQHSKVLHGATGLADRLQFAFLDCIAGHTLKESANSIGVSVGAVKSYRSRAREQIKAEIDSKPVVRACAAAGSS